MTDTEQSTDTSAIESLPDRRLHILAALKIREQVFVSAYVANGGIPISAMRAVGPYLSEGDAARTARRYLRLARVRLAIKQLRALSTPKVTQPADSDQSPTTAVDKNDRLLVTPETEHNPDVDIDSMTKRQVMRQLVSTMLYSYQLVETCDDTDLPSLRETANKLGITWQRLYNWIKNDPDWPKYQSEIKQAQIMAFQARFERAIVSGRGGKTLQYLAGLLNRIDPPMSIGQNKRAESPGRLSKVELERTVKAKHLKFVRGVG